MLRKNRGNSLNCTVRDKMTAYKFAFNTFGIEAKDIIEESGDLHAPFQMSVPLFTPGSPKLLFAPLDIHFRIDTRYKRFTVMLAQPFYVNIEGRCLEKITSFFAAFLSQPERIQLVQARQKFASDAIPEIGVIYIYIDEVNSRMTDDDNNTIQSRTFKKIQHDLIVFFSMLCNYFGVSIDYMVKHAGAGCAELIFDK